MNMKRNIYISNEMKKTLLTTNNEKKFINYFYICIIMNIISFGFGILMNYLEKIRFSF